MDAANARPIVAPPPLLVGAEKMILDCTELLDPWVGLQLAQIVKGLVSTAYAMGAQDGGRSPSPLPCAACPHTTTAEEAP